MEFCKTLNRGKKNPIDFPHDLKAENLKVLLPPFPPLPKPFIGTHALSRFLELLVVLMLLELLYLQGFRFQIQNK